MKFSYGEKVHINYRPEDLAEEDFGASGFTIPSPLKKLEPFLNETFTFVGTLKENEDFKIINYKSQFSDRDFLVHVNYLKNLITL